MRATSQRFCAPHRKVSASVEKEREKEGNKMVESEKETDVKREKIKRERKIER